jgi:hypothetical protein
LEPTIKTPEPEPEIITTNDEVFVIEQAADEDVIEDANSFELQGQIKNLIELSMRMTEVAKATSEWHRRMTSNNLAKNGRRINL